MTTQRDAQKTFDKIRHPFLIKTLFKKRNGRVDMSVYNMFNGERVEKSALKERF